MIHSRRPKTALTSPVAPLDAAPLVQCQLSMPSALLSPYRVPSSAFSNRHTGNIGETLVSVTAYVALPFTPSPTFAHSSDRRNYGNGTR